MTAADTLHLRSRSNPWVQEVRRQLARPSGYRRSGRVWLEGDHLCRAYLERGGLPHTVVVTEAIWDGPLRQGDGQWAQLWRSAEHRVVVSDEVMSVLSSLETPSPVAMWAPWPQGGEGRWRSGVDTVILDRLQDPGNAGSILRSAAALGVRQVVALEGTVALWSPKVMRAGMGAHFGLHLLEEVSLGRLLSEPDVASRLVVTSSHAAQLLPAAPLPPHPVWVFGHEGGGVAPDLEVKAALRVCIPQPGGEESLNVAAAAGICLYESLARRHRGLA